MQDDNWQKIDGWMREYGDRILRLIFLIINDRYAAEEIAQDVFVRAYEYMNSFRGEASPYTWLYRIAINLTRNYIRKQSRFKFILLFIGAKKDFYIQETLEDTVMEEMDRLKVKDCINQLSLSYREVILLFYYEDMRISDIAEVLQLPEGTVKSRLSRGRKQLEKILRREEMNLEREGLF